jgi:hypothetical protein
MHSQTANGLAHARFDTTDVKWRGSNGQTTHSTPQETDPALQQYYTAMLIC